MLAANKHDFTIIIQMAGFIRNVKMGFFRENKSKLYRSFKVLLISSPFSAPFLPSTYLCIFILKIHK